MADGLGTATCGIGEQVGLGEGRWRILGMVRDGDVDCEVEDRYE
jgi:hypothetical protein